MSDSNGLRVAEYGLSTDWDVTTAELAYLFDVTGTVRDLRDIELRSDDSTFFTAEGYGIAQYPETYGGLAFASVQRE